MEFLITSKGAININYIINIQLAEVREPEKPYSGLRIDIVEIDGRVIENLAEDYFKSPSIGDKILTIVTTKTDYRAITFRNQEAEEIWQQFLSKIK